MVFSTTLLDAQHERESKEKKAASSLVASLGKILNGISQSLLSIQAVGPNNLAIAGAHFDCRHVSLSRAHTREQQKASTLPCEKI